MDLIAFLFALLGKFLGKSISEAKQKELNVSALQWRKDQMNHPVVGKVLKFTDLWWCQIILAFVFLFSVKSIADWLVSSPDDDEDSEDDDDDDRFLAMIKAARSKKPRHRDVFSNDISL